MTVSEDVAVFVRLAHEKYGYDPGRIAEMLWWKRVPVTFDEVALLCAPPRCEWCFKLLPWVTRVRSGRRRRFCPGGSCEQKARRERRRRAVA